MHCYPRLLTAVACEQSVIEGGVMIAFSSSNVLVVLYNKSLNDWSLGKQLTLFPSAPARKTLRFLGNKINCFPRTSH